jgi:cobalamin synthase
VEEGGFVLAQHKLYAVVGGVLAAAFVCQAVLGWVLGVTDAWLPVLVVAALLAVLFFADARIERRNAETKAAEGSYDKVVCAVATVAVVAAVALLYLPLPWGGLAGGAVVVALVLALRFSQDHPRG